MSRPITPISPVQSSIPGDAEPLPNSARPTSAKPPSRPVSYLDTYHTDAPSHGDQFHGAPQEASALSQASHLHDEVSHQDQTAPELPRTDTHMTGGSQTLLPSRGGTLKKKPSLHKSTSLKRTASKRSSYAGSVRSLKLGEKEKYAETEETNSAFYCPVPTAGNPTELLANRFQGTCWSFLATRGSC